MPVLRLPQVDVRLLVLLRPVSGFWPPPGGFYTPDPGPAPGRKVQDEPMGDVFEFEIRNHAGRLVVVAQDGVSVKVYARGRQASTSAGIAPGEAREMAAALIRCAGKADAKLALRHGSQAEEET